MRFIKKLIYFIKNKYHPCSLCNDDAQIILEGFVANKKFENLYSDSMGQIHLQCPTCKGTKIVWGEND